MAEVLISEEAMQQLTLAGTVVKDVHRLEEARIAAERRAAEIAAGALHYTSPTSPMSEDDGLVGFS